MEIHLDKKTMNEINEKLPEFRHIEVVTTTMVYFKNTNDMLYLSRFSLNEYYRNKIWYFEKRNPPNIKAGLVLCQYYLDNIALRLYAAGEFLANGIVSMLDIKKDELKEFKKGNNGKKYWSRQRKIGQYLREKKPNHEITQYLKILMDGDENPWIKTMKYRNEWVHKQPPSLEGLGSCLEIKNKKIYSPLKGNTIDADIVITGKPNYKLKDIFTFVNDGFSNFVKTFYKIYDYYKENTL